MFFIPRLEVAHSKHGVKFSDFLVITREIRERVNFDIWYGIINCVCWPVSSPNSLEWWYTLSFGHLVNTVTSLL
jgi:hypothetical protein